MKIHGFQKLTLLDYPEKIAGTLFLGHCNFRCPFCHNAQLVLSADKEEIIEVEAVLDTLKKRKGILEGVCISGGEPTLSPELEDLLRKIKGLDYPIKLDTNGYRPQVLKRLVESGLIDYVAMDIKHVLSKYQEAIGLREFHPEWIQESVDFLMKGSLDYEFRTTVTRELHTKEDMNQIGTWLKGCARYYLQQYRESSGVIRPIFTAYTTEELMEFQTLLSEYISLVELRGVD